MCPHRTTACPVFPVSAGSSAPLLSVSLCPFLLQQLSCLPNQPPSFLAAEEQHNGQGRICKPSQCPGSQGWAVFDRSTRSWRPGRAQEARWGRGGHHHHSVQAALPYIACRGPDILLFGISVPVQPDPCSSGRTGRQQAEGQRDELLHRRLPRHQDRTREYQHAFRHAPASRHLATAPGWEEQATKLTPLCCCCLCRSASGAACGHHWQPRLHRHRDAAAHRGQGGWGTAAQAGAGTHQQLWFGGWVCGQAKAGTGAAATTSGQPVVLLGVKLRPCCRVI